MSENQAGPSGPDFSQGIPLAQLQDGVPLQGHVGEEAVLLVRIGAEFHAIGATCTHYSGPLAEELIVGDTVRCPLHHACFSLRTGEALRAPALNPVACWKVERKADMVHVTGKREPAPRPTLAASAQMPKSIVILGGGGAGNAAAEMLRREGYKGRLVMLSADSATPVDRPNLSKDYLAGNAPEDWIPLRPPEFYREQEIELHLDARVTEIDTAKREVALADGQRYPFDQLLLATGADPVHLDLPGSDLPHVHYLRTLDDSRAIIATAKSAKRAVVVGASFIGLEAAASLRARKLDVHVVAPDAVPMERVMGREVGSFVRKLHEEHGVKFHLGTAPTAIDAKGVTLKNGEVLPADLVVIGVGVRPALALAEKAGLKLDRGLVVDAYLETSAKGIYAAGDIARWPDPHSGAAIRVEHWVVAERQGQVAAKNMLGKREVFDAVPFFWSAHYDVTINYVGHAEKWDEIRIDGTLEARDCRVSYMSGGKALAVVTIGRDKQSLRAERDMEALRTA